MGAGQVELITTASLLRRYRTMTFDFEAQARREVARQAGDGSVSCAGKGCAYCCYSKVVVHLSEGAMMYLHLVATGQWNAALERRLVEADAAMSPTSHADWLSLHRPCVFLKEESFGRGACTVYPLRPLGCASTFSVGDPAGCAVVGGDHIAFIDAHYGREFVLLQSAIGHGLGQKTEWSLTIPGAVLYARALIEGLPLPDVHKMDVLAAARDGRQDGSYFDEGAAARGRR